MMTKQLCSSLISLILAVSLVHPVWAKDILTIPPAMASGEQGRLPRLQLWPGSGLNISLDQTGEYIKKIILDDPSRITFDVNAPLNSPDAQYIHLRRINQLNFKNLPTASTTLLTVITNKNRYQFILGYGEGQPQYYGVTLVKANENVFLSYNGEWLDKINAGLRKAIDENLISAEQGNLVLVERVNRLLTLVADGTPLNDALAMVGLSRQFIDRLEHIGTKTQPLKSEETQEENLDDLMLEWFFSRPNQILTD
ncbi:MAG: hypothetical protein QNJ37_08735 [Crocosphaera sp.]|nr:hypothetical protein [Crocosphaera sp.]